jgi:hypothetical protein
MNDQNVIRWKNLVREADNRLVAAGIPEGDIERCAHRLARLPTTTASLVEALRAAADGRLDVLFVPVGVQRWARSSS